MTVNLAVFMTADRPRAAHKLDLRVGDVVELMAWQLKAANQGLRIGETFVVGSEQWEGFIARHNPKGHRPLFCLISRAADATPDGFIRAGKAKPADVITIYHQGMAYMIVFAEGSDVGSVTRERL